jgi:hypothetical protein
MKLFESRVFEHTPLLLTILIKSIITHPFPELELPKQITEILKYDSKNFSRGIMVHTKPPNSLKLTSSRQQPTTFTIGVLPIVLGA